MKLQRYKNNPFLVGMIIPVRDRNVRVSHLGKDDNVLINQVTGEVFGTHVTTYRKVDSDKFVKLFCANVAQTFDLTASGIKSFNVLLWEYQRNGIGRDVVDLDMPTLDDFLEAHPLKKLSYVTFWRGLSELCKAQIIARTVRKGRYFINPNFVFNGDRIAFTTFIEREDNQQLTIDYYQPVPDKAATTPLKDAALLDDATAPPVETPVRKEN